MSWSYRYRLPAGCKDVEKGVTNFLGGIGDLESIIVKFQLVSTIEYPRPKLDMFLRQKFIRWSVCWESPDFPIDADIVKMVLDMKYRSAQLFVKLLLLRYDLLKIKF